ncbi:hypothetical protein ACVWYF_000765 [Hymenobacter sp. UYAg731]
MQNVVNKYYPYRVRWQQSEGFLLWLERPEPERESLWTDAQNKVPIFETCQHLGSFVLGLGKQLQNQETSPTNLDAVVAWLTNGTEQPAEECLSVWNLFDDLSAGVQKLFVGNEHNPERDLVFDLLYAQSGPYLSSEIAVPWRIYGPMQWQPEQLQTLRHILTQGLGLWQQSTYWQRDAKNLPQPSDSR